MMKFFRFLKKLIETNSEESSKRFIALFSMILISYVVARFTTLKNSVAVLEILLAFVLVLMGVAVWQSIKNKEK